MTIFNFALTFVAGAMTWGWFSRQIYFWVMRSKGDLGQETRHSYVEKMPPDDFANLYAVMRQEASRRGLSN